ncbi:MAG: ribose 5-phosphate isomerase B [Bacteroidales bacterium]|nr:ribose 5-phosphate isomerase B [Bacteroidales bacterium]
MKITKLFMASDHAGYELKLFVKDYLVKKGFDVTDLGTNSSESCDYADYAHPLAIEVEKDPDFYGITICGSGNGISMTANKHQGIRAALCWNEEISRLARSHNNANVLSMPARFISQDEAIKILEAFLNTEFEGGRHQRRIEKMPVK